MLRENELITLLVSKSINSYWFLVYWLLIRTDGVLTNKRLYFLYFSLPFWLGKKQKKGYLKSRRANSKPAGVCSQKKWCVMWTREQLCFHRGVNCSAVVVWVWVARVKNAVNSPRTSLTPDWVKSGKFTQEPIHPRAAEMLIQDKSSVWWRGNQKTKPPAKNPCR